MRNPLATYLHDHLAGAVVAAADARLRGVDFDHLGTRAHAQHARVEEYRLEAARAALRAAQE